MSAPSSRVRGTTLIEIMVSMSMIFLVLTSTASVIIASSNQIASGERLEIATRLGQNLMSVLASVPYTASGAGNAASPQTLFSNITVANDGDIMDTALVFAQPTLSASAYDHSDADLAPLAAMLVSPSAGSITFERYWNVSPAASGSGVDIAVIVRWRNKSTWQRTVIMGTRYQP